MLALTPMTYAAEKPGFTGCDGLLSNHHPALHCCSQLLLGACVGHAQLYSCGLRLGPDELQEQDMVLVQAAGGQQKLVLGNLLRLASRDARE